MGVKLPFLTLYPSAKHTCGIPEGVFGHTSSPVSLDVGAYDSVGIR